ncbi:membrane transport protein-domain-containing protein [Melampsora americana]|nr:membrane transport protein-domain-containing protein [Melampsora americana]
MSQIVGIILTVIGSISQVFLLSLAGYVLARNKIITPKSRTSFNEANNCFFTPAFVFQKIAYSLTADQLIKLYVVVLAFVFITILSAILAYIPARIFRLASSDRNLCMAVSMFMNSNSLPIAIATSMLAGMGSPSGFEWGPMDNRDKQMARSLSYFVLFSTFGLILRWSYGVKLLAVSPTEEKVKTKRPKVQEPGDLWNVSRREKNKINCETSYKPPKVDLNVVIDDETRRLSACPANLKIKEGYGRWTTLGLKILKIIVIPVKMIYRCMTPTLYSTIISFLVVCIPPLQTALMGFKPLRGAFNFAGNVAVPLTLVVLGAYFDKERPTVKESEMKKPETIECPQKSHNSDEETLEASLESQISEPSCKVSDRTIMTIGIVARQILAPLVLIPLLYFIPRTLPPYMREDMNGNVLGDPCFILVMALLIGSPPAITLVQMTNANQFPVGSLAHVQQEFRNNRIQHLISRTLLGSYVFVTPIVTIIVAMAAVLIVKANA